MIVIKSIHYTMVAFLRSAASMLFLTALLTLATWILFYFATPDALLTKQTTFVVFGGWLLLLMVIQAFRKGRRSEVPKE